MGPKVSVLTTVYNREKYLRECLESVQTERFQDYEHIVVDDGSTDASQSIAFEIAKSDTRIQFQINQSNLGDYPNRNQAASLARGKYLKYLDADDWHGRWCLEVMADAMEMYPDAGLGLFDDGHNRHYQPQLISGEEAIRRYYSGESKLFHRSPLNAMIRKESFEFVGGFNEDPFTGDYNLWHQLAKNFPVVLFPNQNNLYRHHDDQQTTQNASNAVNKISHLLARINNLNDTTLPIDPDLRNKNLKLAYRKLARTILVHIRNGHWSSAKKVKHKLGWGWRTVLNHAR